MNASSRSEAPVSHEVVAGSGILKSLFDIQVNGFAGVDFQQETLSIGELRFAVEQLAVHQTHRFFLTLITDSIDALCRKLHQIESYRMQDKHLCEAICGYHIEGPWLSRIPGYCGAHDPAKMSDPDMDSFRILQESAHGNIRLVTLAPELTGAIPFIEVLTKAGVAVSLGHTNADMQSIEAAINAGARFCTHLGNAVPGELPRHDNVIQRLLSRDELFAFFVPDGIHLPPNVLKNFVRAKPADKVLFTTDCMAGAGTDPGRYTLGALGIEVSEDRIARFPGGTNFAGSTLTPDAVVINVKTWLDYDEVGARSLFSTSVADLFGIDLPEIEQAI